MTDEHREVVWIDGKLAIYGRTLELQARYPQEKRDELFAKRKRLIAVREAEAKRQAGMLQVVGVKKLRFPAPAHPIHDLNLATEAEHTATESLNTQTLEQLEANLAEMARHLDQATRNGVITLRFKYQRALESKEANWEIASLTTYIQTYGAVSRDLIVVDSSHINRNYGSSGGNQYLIERSTGTVIAWRTSRTSRWLEAAEPINVMVNLGGTEPAITIPLPDVDDDPTFDAPSRDASLAEGDRARRNSGGRWRF